MPTSQDKTSGPPTNANKMSKVEEFARYVLNNQEKLYGQEDLGDTFNLKLVHRLIGQIMMSLSTNTSKCRRYLNFFESKDISLNEALAVVLRKLTRSRYVLRLFLRDDKALDANLLAVPYKNQKDFRGQIRLKVNPDLPKEERIRLQDDLGDVLKSQEENFYLHPGRISQWFIPEINACGEELNGKIIKGHKLDCKVVHNKSGLGFLLTCSPVDEKHVKSRTIFIGVELAYLVPCHVTSVSLQNPLPFASVHHKYGWKILSSVKKDMEEGYLITVAYSKLQKASLQQQIAEETDDFTANEGKINQTFDKDNVNRQRQQNLNKRKTKQDGRNEETDKSGVVIGAWDVDYSDMETAVVERLVTSLNLGALNAAIQLYIIFSELGEQTLPKIEETFWDKVKFWVIKKHYGKATTITAWFRAVLEFIHNLLKTCFCASPSRNSLLNVCPVKKGDVPAAELANVQKVLACVKENDVTEISFITGIYQGFILSDV